MSHMVSKYLNIDIWLRWRKRSLFEMRRQHLYSSLPSIRASICVGPARIPEDFVAKGKVCNVATNINQMKEFSLEIPNAQGTLDHQT